MSILEHITNSIKQTKVDPEPFPHMYIRNFFEENFYTKLLNSLPEKEKFVPINKTGSVSDDYPEERFILNINPEILKSFEGKDQEVFSDIVNGFFFKMIFFNSVLSNFKSTIDDRIKNFSEEEIKLFGKNNFNFEGRIALVKDYTKYQLGAHTDSPNKFLTFLFYLPRDETIREIGTSLYKPLNKDITTSFSSHYTMEETNNNFVETKKAEFLPNSVLIFPRTNYSYHGVSSINIGSQERNLLLLNYYFKKNK